MSLRISLTGMKQVRKALHDYGKTKTEEMRDATNRAGLSIQGEAKRRLASGMLDHPTGRLASSIHLKKEDMENTVYTNLDYAPFVEFGTGDRVFITKPGIDSVEFSDEAKSEAAEHRGEGKGEVRSEERRVGKEWRWRRGPGD